MRNQMLFLDFFFISILVWIFNFNFFFYHSFFCHSFIYSVSWCFETSFWKYSNIFRWMFFFFCLYLYLYLKSKSFSSKIILFSLLLIYSIWFKVDCHYKLVTTNHFRFGSSHVVVSCIHFSIVITEIIAICSKQSTHHYSFAYTFNSLKLLFAVHLLLHHSHHNHHHLILSPSHQQTQQHFTFRYFHTNDSFWLFPLQPLPPSHTFHAFLFFLHVRAPFQNIAIIIATEAIAI